MHKKIKIIAAVTLCAAMFASCGKSGGSADVTEKPADAAQASEAAADTVTAAEDPNAVDPNEPFDLEKGVTEKMYNRAFVSEGNIARLAHAMKKAKSGEAVTVGVIGGSITQGSLASEPSKCYASLFNKWWENKFPDAEIKFVNAGIGGTNSYLGVHRVDSQLLAYDPDVVIVEFSVNDTDKLANKNSYDSLVRKILSHSSDPAVILLFTTQEDGTSLQDTHMEIGQAYDLPMLSYKNAVYPEVAAGTLKWTDISPDNIHPNDAGHEIINQIVSRYLDGVYDKLDTVTEEPSAFTAGPLTKDYYANAKMYGSNDIEPAENVNFDTVDKAFYDQFKGNWKTEGGGKLTFNADCRNVGIFYLRTVDGKSGKYEVYVDGQRKGTLDGDFSGGWGTYGETKQVLFAGETANHTIEIIPAEGSEDKGITILGLMLS